MNTPILANEISVFEKLLPSIREKHGAVWAVVANRDFQGGFSSFSEAIQYAAKRFPVGQFLVRHTEAQQPYIPFVVVEE